MAREWSPLIPVGFDNVGIIPDDLLQNASDCLRKIRPELMLLAMVFTIPNKTPWSHSSVSMISFMQGNSIIHSPSATVGSLLIVK